MHGERDSAKISQAYLVHRPYLVDLAFRMLGEIGAAEDVVQDAFSRLIGADLGAIEDQRGWLIVVTSRLCLDQIRSARSRRERTHDSAEIEYIAPAAGRLADPADRVTFDDRVRLALLVLLQRLSPAERVVFVLHDIFQLPFDAIAQTVGRTAPGCRQLARRARQKLAAGQDGVRPVVVAEHRLVTEKFIAACGNGDIRGLLDVLAPDVWGQVDRGPSIGRQPVVRGAEQVARNLLRFWGEGATLVSVPAGAQPALLGFVDRKLTGILVFTMRDQSIQAVQVIADPDLLGFFSAQLSTRPDPA